MGQTADVEKRYYSFTKRVFSFIAPFYDLMVLPFSASRKKVVEFTGATAGAMILDVATGTGKQAFAFAELGFSVTGIDMTRAMLDIAIRKNRFNNLVFEEGDAASLPYRDESFDMTTISYALHEMPGSIRVKVLKEMARVTKTDGCLILVDYGLPKNRLGRFLVYHIIKFYERSYYADFIKCDLAALYKESGITVNDEKSILLGAARIIKAARK